MGRGGEGRGGEGRGGEAREVINPSGISAASHAASFVSLQILPPNGRNYYFPKGSVNCSRNGEDCKI